MTPPTPKEKKEAILVIRIEQSLLERLMRYCKGKGCSKGKVVRSAIEGEVER